MSCNITAGKQLGCRDSQGGVKRVYIWDGIGNADDLIDATEIGNDNLITAMSSSTWYQFDQVRTTADFTQNLVGSLENGVVTFEPTINLQFHKIDAETNKTIQTLAKNPALRVIVEQNDGRSFFAGHENGLTLDAGSAASGKAFSDLNGYTITLSGNEKTLAPQLSGSSLATDHTELTLTYS